MDKPLEEILKILQNGNQRFINDKEKNYNFIKTRKRLIKKQDPFVIILGCSDSRVPLELIFDVNLGEIFEIKIAGNITNEDILESIQYALNEFNCSTVIVLGHENCGAIQMAIDGVNNDITQKIKKVMEKSNDKNVIIDKNIQQSIDEIKSYLEENNILNKFVIGAKYSLESGEVKFLMEKSARLIKSEFYNSYKIGFDYYECFINPTSEEWRIAATLNGKFRGIRAIIEENGTTYAWSSELLHEDAIEKLNIPDGVRISAISKNEIDISLIPEITIDILQSAFNNSTSLYNYISKNASIGHIYSDSMDVEGWDDLKTIDDILKSE